MKILSSLALWSGLLLFGQGVPVQAGEYSDLSAQQQADLSRFLGWVWADGRPLDTSLVTGIRSEVSHGKYNAVVGNLLEAGLGLELGKTNGVPSKIRIKEPWDFWNNALPGGNVGDPALLRDAIRNPNFLAGIIEGEGDTNSADGDYYIDDHFHGPSRLDKAYGLANFGPERILQLFELLGETYGFTNTVLEVGAGANPPRYTYSELDAARADLQRKYDAAKAQNDGVNNGNGEDYRNLIRTRIYIHPTHWDTLRSYGFFFTGRIPISPSGTPHRSVSNGPASDLPLAEGTMSFFDAILTYDASVTRVDAESVQLSWTAPNPSDVVDIQHSQNLVDWTTIQTGVSGNQATLTIKNAGNGFFRVRRVD